MNNSQIDPGWQVKDSDSKVAKDYILVSYGQVQMVICIKVNHKGLTITLTTMIINVNIRNWLAISKGRAIHI
jgi:hypothetical protein